MDHTIYFGNGELYPSGDRKAGQFNGFDIFEKWHLIPQDRPSVAMPGTDTKFVTIPGRDGDLDLSEWLRAGRPAYRNRSGSWSFYVEDGHEWWMTIYPKIANTIHGKTFKIVLEDDPDYYWEGRFAIEGYDAQQSGPSTVTIQYNLQPFKRRIRKNSQLMVWDTFNFEKDYDHDPFSLNSNLIINGTKTVDIWGDGFPFPLEVTWVNGSVSVTFGGETKTVSSGGTTNVGHAVYGMNQLILSGTGTVRVDWRGGSL